ncbi:mechanosensitive ion channel-like protein family [Massariosphaeria phaeospora]|uniref:Mechanosensitive ion channel-like protein family n=1 Tax=Massariosphaeria phaeospora TaxID=100035 RepID=A0A7C8IC10_9PLEO|nr:mechanosensitive ion channel-like protein family [Massariosphaeria phaeospora]
MSTPVGERPEPTYNMDSNMHNENTAPLHRERSLDDDGTYIGEALSPQNSNSAGRALPHSNTHLTVETDHMPSMNSMPSPAQTREQASRLDDDLAMLQVERDVQEQEGLNREQSQSRSMRRVRSRREDPIDEFETATNPVHERAAIYKPPESPANNFSKFVKKVHGSSFLVRYFFYIIPVVLILLIPLLLGALLFKDAHVGGVRMMWFCVWLQIFWLSLWAGRILAKCLPWPIGLISSLFTNNSKKWRDMGKQLELPATLFFWWLAILCSFLPTMKNHHNDGKRDTKDWERTMNTVLLAVFVGMVLNFVEKIIIQLIAISFHLRTYADRIDINKFQIGSLAKLYKYSKEQITMEDSEFESKSGPASGARTPGQLVKEAQKSTKEAFSKFGDIAGKVAGDFTGRQVTKSTHPHQVVLTLLSSTNGSQVLARRLYRTFGREETETVHSEDLKNAFETDEEADAAFSMFDKDMNGDISMEELEAVCVEIGRERKSITASLKDLDSVVSKLDDVFMFIVLIITVLVFISLISSSAATVLTSAGSTLLALSWLFSVTAQEFLQSCIFVFVKHPYDVGDRVGIYGNTGALGRGDDYFVKEIALFYTEFKKMEGHVVQAPNSYLNTLFILNQRRSGALAEAVPTVIKFGTTVDQIDQLRQRLLEFVKSEKREYQGNILTELREVDEVHSLTLNVVFFYKSNWQNELLRLQRRNKFICVLMISMQECGIEGPRMRYPGQKESFPVYLSNVPHAATPGAGHNGTPDNPSGINNQHEQHQDESIIPQASPGQTGSNPPNRFGSILRTGGGRARGESMAAMGRRVDFSLGMKDISAGDLGDDLFEDRESDRSKAARIRVTSPARPSQDRPRASHETGRSTALAERPSNQSGHLQRVNTDSTQARSNRNRFFGRNRRQDEEAGMANIPESGHDTPERERLDQRTGLMSPAGLRMSVDESRPPQSPGAGPGTADSERTFLPHGPHRSVTDNFEMRHLR